MAENIFRDDKIYVLDGAMGTMIQKKGFISGCFEKLNITNPELIQDIHKEYADAGCDIIMTNTFGANSSKLDYYNLHNRVKDINRAALDNARKAAPGRLIAGDIGPLIDYIEPIGRFDFDDAYHIYKEQIKGLRGSDLLIIETISDIRTLRAAVFAAKDHSRVPIIACMTFDGKRTSIGTDVKTFTSLAHSLDVDVIGANCSIGPEKMADVIRIIAKNTDKPVYVKPNAGIPKLIDGKTIFSSDIDDFIKYSRQLLQLGVGFIGGCCGTTPEYISKLVELAKSFKPKKRNPIIKTRFCSRTKTVDIDKTIIVGERINPTNRKDLKEEIRQHKTNIIKEQALSQVHQGAHLLDINIGIAGFDEKDFFGQVVSEIQNIVDAPLCFDTTNAKALEYGLRACEGKPLINSVNGSEKSMNEVLPLAKKYGAGVVALCVDERGIPKDVSERVEIAKKITSRALDYGIKKEDIVVDCVAMSIGLDKNNEDIIINSVKEIKKLGYPTILGISNISHGMPNRYEINRKFFTKAVEAGLDMAIINPTDAVLEGDTSISFEQEKFDYRNMPINDQLYNAILYGDKDYITEIIEDALKVKNPIEISNIFAKSLKEVGEKFNRKEYFLPNLILSAQTMKIAFERLKKEFKKGEGSHKARIILATVKDDIHDIGKNIAAVIFESHNFEIIDLGKSVSTEEIIDSVKKHKPDMIGLSALMTTTITGMKEVKDELEKNNLNIPLIIGGAVVDEEYAKSINAIYAKDALDGVKKAEELI